MCINLCKQVVKRNGSNGCKGMVRRGERGIFPPLEAPNQPKVVLTKQAYNPMYIGITEGETGLSNSGTKIA